MLRQKVAKTGMGSVNALHGLRKLLRDCRGNALVIGAATLPLVIGAAAIGVDTIQVSVARRQLQRAADSGALAGAHARHQSRDVDAAVGRDLGLNNDIPLTGAAVVENAPTTGTYAGNPRAVRVSLTAERSLPFISFFTGEPMTVRTEATAMAVLEGEYCMVSLEESAVTGIEIKGNSTVDLGCGMISNSPSASAVIAGGSSVVRADPIAAVGGVPPSGSYASDTTLLPYSLRQEDPFAGLPQPTVPTGCSSQALRVQPTDPPLTVTSSTQGYVSPGVYCWRGMDIKGTVTLPANSVIYIDGGEVDFGAQAVVNGDGVTLILTSDNAATSPSQIAQLKINGGATLNLTAPSTGPYAGLLMYQDRRAQFGSSHINGNSSTFLRGAFYFPKRELVFNGTAGMRTECIQMVAQRLSFSGNAAINNQCPAGSGSNAFQATRIRLVG